MSVAILYALLNVPVFALEKALYTLIYIYVSTRILNLVVTGLSQRKAVYIISPSWEEISHKILEDINRGVTIIQGQGAYTGKEEKILYKVVNFREVSRLKQLIRGIDSKAFVVVAIHWRQWGTELETSPNGDAFQTRIRNCFIIANEFNLN